MPKNLTRKPNLSAKKPSAKGAALKSLNKNLKPETQNLKQITINVIPVKTGIQSITSIIDSRLRGNDKRKFRAAGNWKFVSLAVFALIVSGTVVYFSLLPQSARSKTFTFFQTAQGL